jgi:lipopolysaccharide biosynthesis protein
MARPSVRAIAFYLPQFHPIPENDEWWGQGFTEWTNVTKATPLFRGHYQPHLPADLGFYDLRLPEAREAQATLARQYGIGAFCYYHYWFNGRRVLQRPFTEVLQSGNPDFPFCLCWANENWTRVWDGGEQSVLLQQQYSAADDERHIEYLIDAFRDRRYLRIAGKPVLLVYRTGLLPDPAGTARLWREKVRAAGLPGLYLMRVESWGDYTDPPSIGFDAAVEFAPDFGIPFKPIGHRESWDLTARVRSWLRKRGVASNAYVEHKIYDYATLIREMSNKADVAYPRFRCVTPGWDNSPRRARGARIFRDAAPDAYELWLRSIVEGARAKADPEERIVFINAWNEWAEGNHLEPDQRWGRAFLEATARALNS